MALVIIVELEFFLLKKRLEIGKKVSLCKLFGCLWDFLQIKYDKKTLIYLTTLVLLNAFTLIRSMYHSRRSISIVLSYILSFILIDKLDISSRAFCGYIYSSYWHTMILSSRYYFV